MKQLRPLIARIIKKIPEKDLEQMINYLGVTYPAIAFPEIAPFMSMVMKERDEYRDALLNQKDKEKNQPEPPADSFGATGDDDSRLPM